MSNEAASCDMGERLPGWLWLAPALFLINFAACTSGSSTSRAPGGGANGGAQTVGKGQCLGIVNGQTTSDYTSVALLGIINNGLITGTCSGTFVSDSTLITAAHCLSQGGASDLVYLPGATIDLGADVTTDEKVIASGVLARQTFTKGVAFIPDANGNENTNLPLSVVHNDLAVVVFPAHTAPAASPLLGRPVHDKELATLAGYGLTTIPTNEPSGSDHVKQRRIGTNVAHKVTSEADLSDLVLFSGRKDGTTTNNSGAPDSMASFGDSGGPIFISGALAGATHGGAIMDASQQQQLPGDAYMIAADLGSADALALFASAKAQGATFATSDQSFPTNTGAVSNTACSPTP